MIIALPAVALEAPAVRRDASCKEACVGVIRSVQALPVSNSCNTYIHTPTPCESYSPAQASTAHRTRLYVGCMPEAPVAVKKKQQASLQGKSTNLQAAVQRSLLDTPPLPPFRKQTNRGAGGPGGAMEELYKVGQKVAQDRRA